MQHVDRPRPICSSQFTFRSSHAETWTFYDSITSILLSNLNLSKSEIGNWKLHQIQVFRVKLNLKDLPTQVTDVFLLPPLFNQETNFSESKNIGFLTKPRYQIQVWSKHFRLIWNSISALQASTVLYLFLKISNLAKYHFEFLLHLLSLYHLKWVSTDTDQYFSSSPVSETKMFPSTFLFLFPSGETLCLRWWGHKRAFKAVTLAPGGPLLAPPLWPLPEKTRDGFLKSKPGNQGEVVQQLGVLLRPGLLPRDRGGWEGDGGAAPLVPPPRHQHQLHLEQPHQVARSRPWDLARGACNQGENV